MNSQRGIDRKNHLLIETSNFARYQKRVEVVEDILLTDVGMICRFRMVFLVITYLFIS